MENKPTVEIKAFFENVNEIKEFLPQIKALQEKYDVQLKIVQQEFSRNPSLEKDKGNV